MKTKKIVTVLLAVMLAVCALTGCSQSKKEAVRVMQDYTNHIIKGEYRRPGLLRSKAPPSTARLIPSRTTSIWERNSAPYMV